MKAEETELIRSVDIAALNLLTDRDDAVTYINALIQVERPDDNEKNFSSQTWKTLGMNIRPYKSESLKNYES